MSLSDDVLRAEIERGDTTTSSLRHAIDQFRQSPVGARRQAVVEALIYDPTTFEQIIAREQAQCAATQDCLSVIELAFDKALASEQELVLGEQLLELASHPGDIVGVTSDRSYAIALPWTDEEQARQLASVALGMACYAVPSQDASIGTQTLTTTMPRRPIAKLPAPARASYQVSASIGHGR
jgi:hypothetical protein